MKSLDDVIKFVVEAHHGQYRKGNGMPYIVHPFDVMKKMSNYGIKDIDVLKAALAHDVLEERPDITLPQLAAEIGDKATNIVQELTFIVKKDLAIPASIQKRNYMAEVGKKSIEALTVKIADRISNTMDFYYGDDPYCYKYWFKAEQVIKAFQARENEIKQFFGENVFYGMSNDVFDTSFLVSKFKTS